MSKKEIFKNLLEIQNGLRIQHWLPKGKIAHHLFFEKASESIDEKIDDFIESYSGKFSDVEYEGTLTLEIPRDFTPSEMILRIDKIKDHLVNKQVYDNSELEDILLDIKNELNTLAFHLRLS